MDMRTDPRRWQMVEAARGAAFVVRHEDIEYGRALARFVGRDDLVIVGRDAVLTAMLDQLESDL